MTLPQPTKEAVLNAALPSWYPVYRDVTLKSVIIPLPDVFLRWLKMDGVSLPAETPTHIFCTRSSDDDEDSDDGENDGGNSDNDKEFIDCFDFTELNRAVAGAIASLGGAVFPKLNWSAPQDASWMNMGTLKCTAPGDIYILLKSSDFVSYDLHYPFDGCVAGNGKDGNSSVGNSSGEIGEETGVGNTIAAFSYVLVLRRWCNLRPERSFRCFVRQRRVVGISQRDCTAHFPQLVKAAGEIEDAIVDFLESTGRPTKKLIESEILPAKTKITTTHDAKATTVKPDGDAKSINSTRWWEQRIIDRYPDEDFVVDVYVDQKLKVFLVDCNVWGGSTDSLLFAWDRLPLVGALPEDSLDRSSRSEPIESLGTRVSTAEPISNPSMGGSDKSTNIEGHVADDRAAKGRHGGGTEDAPPSPDASTIAPDTRAAPSLPPAPGSAEAWAAQQIAMQEHLEQIEIEDAAQEREATTKAAQPLRFLRFVEKGGSYQKEGGGSSQGGGDSSDQRSKSSGGAAIRATKFSDYRAPIEMHRFAAAQAMGVSSAATSGDSSSSSPAEDMCEFTRFIRECEEKERQQRKNGDL